jgi:hypothetical protein
MKQNKQEFPDISDLLRRKSEGRKRNAARSFGEKIDILEAMRRRLSPINVARNARRPKETPQS